MTFTNFTDKTWILAKLLPARLCTKLCSCENNQICIYFSSTIEMQNVLSKPLPSIPLSEHTSKNPFKLELIWSPASHQPYFKRSAFEKKMPLFPMFYKLCSYLKGSTLDKSYFFEFYKFIEICLHKHFFEAEFVTSHYAF